MAVHGIKIIIQLVSDVPDQEGYEFQATAEEGVDDINAENLATIHRKGNCR